jgi:hypothetical protein
MAGKIEDILDNCLERMLKGESLEDCLQAYPERASALEPLLKTGLTFIQSSAVIKPTSEFKTRVRSQLLATLDARRGKVGRREAIPMWPRRWVVAVASVLVILLAGVGTVAASANALPDEPLYSVKLATEQVRMRLASSDMDRTKLHVQFAEQRALEIAEMACQGKSDKFPVLTEQFANHLDEARVAEKAGRLWEKGPKIMAPPSAPGSPSTSPPSPSDEAEAYSRAGEGTEGELKALLIDSRARSLHILQTALARAPKKTRPILEQIIADIAENYDEALFDLESDGSP